MKILPPISQSVDFNAKDSKGSKSHFAKVTRFEKQERGSNDLIWFGGVISDDARASVPLVFSDDERTNKTSL